MRSSLLAAVIFLTAVTGCSIGPDYQSPDPPALEQFTELGRTPAAPQPITISAQTADLSRWWRLFHDEELNALVDRAVAANFDLRMAQARVREARFRLAAADARYLPQVSGAGSYSHSRISENGLPFGAPAGSIFQGTPLETMGKKEAADIEAAETNSGMSVFSQLPEFNLYELGFDSSWELDIFGRTRRLVEAAEAQLEAAEQSRRAVTVSLISETARSYVDLRGFQRQRRIAEKNVKAQQETLELTRDQVRNGVATELDVARAEAQVHMTEAQIPVLVRQERQAIHRLAVLLGEEPGLLDHRLRPEASIPTPPSQVFVGIPGELLRRRPDIRRAERELAGAAAAAGAAQADLYPRLALRGSFAFASSRPATLFEGASRMFSLGPAISVPLFEGGALRAIVGVRSEQLDQAFNSYQRTVITALHEVEDAVVTVRTEQEHQAALTAALAAQSEALRMAAALYRQGLIDFLTVLEAERSLYAADAALAQSQRLLVTYVIALYKALGGGWEVPGGE